MVLLPSIVITQLLKYPPLQAQWPPRLVYVTSIVFVKVKYPREVEAGIVAEYVKEVGVIYFRDMPHITYNL